MQSKVRQLRIALGYTQLALAEMAQLSLSTIQRVESGRILPKGHTLKALSKALGVSPSELSEKQSVMQEEDLLNIQIINLSSLAFIGIPFGNVFIPMLLWNKKRKAKIVDQLGRRIINFQILWSVATALFLILSPFVQKAWSLPFSLLLWGFACSGLCNLFIIGKTALKIQKKQLDFLNFKIRLL